MRTYFFLFWILWGIAGCNSLPQTPAARQNASPKRVYVCPMHPQIRRDHPGQCPICGMTLQPRAAEHEAPSEDSAQMERDSMLHFLEQPVTQTVVGDLATVVPRQSPVADTLQAFGYLSFDPRYSRTITSRVTGRIETLYVNALYTSVQAGQALMRVYSPELLALQRNWIQAIRQHDTMLMASLAQNLINQGMLPEELQKVKTSLQPVMAFTIKSPASGMLTAPDGDMFTQDLPTSQPFHLPFLAGAYVQAGIPILAVQDNHHAWAILRVSNEVLAQIQPGDAVTIYQEAQPLHRIQTHIDFISPMRDDNMQQFAEVRIYLHDLPAGWKWNSLIRAYIFPHHGPAKGLFIPRSAVDHLGQHDVVWVQDVRFPDVFHARAVQLGRVMADWVQVINGLSPTERIAKQAAYLVDSDSFVSWTTSDADSSSFPSL